MKKLHAFLLVGALLLGGLLTTYITYPDVYRIIDKQLRSFMFKIRGSEPISGDVAIVDIDEKSLKDIGQWPWQRDRVAELIYNIASSEPKAIGLDIVFAESDNSSPRKVLKELGYEDYMSIPDNDEILAEVLAGTPTISGYVFALNDDGMEPDRAPKSDAITIQRDKGDREYLPKPYRAILNIPTLQESAQSTGYFNTIPDDDGVIRRVPLMMVYNDQVHPALSLEMIRYYEGEKKIYIDYDSTGVSSITLGKHHIPTDMYGRMLVNFYGGAYTFDYISASEIIEGSVDTNRLKDKYILIGTSAAGLLDLRSTPFESVYPGVEVHATVIENIITDNYIYRPSWSNGAELLVTTLIFILSFIAFFFSGATIGIGIALIVASGLTYGVYYMMFESGIVFSLAFPLLALIFSYLGATVINYIYETRQKEFIKAKFAKKVSPAVVEELISSSDGNILAGKEKYITIFFSDVRSFTTISEQMGSPKALIDLLNEYMTPMVDIVVEHKGTIDKFIGDAIMAYWNAPNNVENHEDMALQASILQIKALKPLNEKLQAENKPFIDIGIGLNSGNCTAGEMGSSGRADYTVIGDPVNLGSRLEGLCKPYGAKIILSEFTKAGLEDESKYFIRELDRVRVKGKSEPVTIYECLGFAEDKTNPSEIEEYEKALELYHTSEFQGALEIFKDLHSRYEHKLYGMYEERCEHFVANPPEDFDGVFTFTTK
jgi:adenylate cyclase